MIQVKNRNYFINENLIEKVFSINERYFAKDTAGNRVELEEQDFIDLGGKVNG